MKIAVYSRKSKFTGKGESIQNQIQLCKEYAHNHFNVDDIYIYEDEGFSGGNINRPKFKQLIEDAEDKKFDVIICYRLDRISRNISDFSTLIDSLNELGISFVSVREQFDTSTPMGRAMMFIASVFAQLERETIAERIKDNMHQLARSGRWLGGTCPTGFKSEPIVYIDDSMKEKKMYKLTPVSDELDVIKHLYQKYLELKSLSKLESYCLRNNFKTKNGKDFQKSSLSDILTNPVYAVADEYIYNYFDLSDSDVTSDISEFDGKHGIMGYNKKLVNAKTSKRKDISDWVIAVAKHKGIISGKDWVAVQDIMMKNKIKVPRKGSSNKALLSGLIVCGNCGSFFRVGYGSLKEDGERYYYYRCNMKDLSRKGRCNIKNLSGEKTDEIIINKIKSSIIPRILKSLSQEQKNIKDELSKTREIRNKINVNKKAIENLVKNLSETLDASVSKYILDEIKRLDDENNKMEKNLNQNNDDKEKVNYDALREKSVNFSHIIDSTSYEEKKNLVNSIVKKIVWDGRKLNIVVYNI